LHLVKKKKRQPIAKSELKAICIDDFALKKGQRYGTIMIDADSRRVIDMIESREADDVASWLKGYPGVKFVSRDGSTTYANAIDEALPDAAQISDRFHLLQNLTKKAKVCFQRIFQGRIKIPMTSGANYIKHVMSVGTTREKILLIKRLKAEGRTNSEINAITGARLQTVKKYIEMDESLIPKDKQSTVRGREHEIAVQKTMARVNRVKELSNNGVSVYAIAKETGFTCNTVKIYLSDDFTPVTGNYGKKGKGKLSKYQETVLRMRAEGKTYKEIFDTIKAEGYTGTEDAIRGFISKERRIRADILKNTKDGEKTELIDKKWVLRLLYKPFKEVSALTKEQFSAILKEYPKATVIFKMVNRFKGLVSRRDINALSKWIEDALALDVEELVTFANSLKNDIAAVRNALLYDYSNGIAEGSVNKVKVIKRIMYGRCSFDLLKNKTLCLESYKRIN